MALETALPTIAVGVGIPAVGAWLTGQFPDSLKQFYGKEGKNLMIYSLVGIAVAGMAFMTQSKTPQAATIQYRQTPMSVSAVTAQLGRYAGGINYPGQATNGDGLVFVD
jgi:uncharacterized membrane protein YidH (DUF202 family)